MIERALYILLLFLAVPVANIIYKLCKDEVKKWEKRLILSSLISIILAIVILFSGFIYKIPVMISLLFIAIVNLIIAYKAHK
ncbi:MAG: hypothetical protein Q8N99_01580 [Nanoarchaeota archaeon]|nr:hypothetical protein [Nanoarchaeota archaeon]